jgi:hypothetical protein
MTLTRSIDSLLDNNNNVPYDEETFAYNEIVPAYLAGVCVIG